jgi:polyhydroxyalkanoate synthesis regulator phasin
MMFSKKAKRPPVKRPNIPAAKKETPGKKELEDWYKRELFKRDRIIDELREKNTLLMKTSMKRSEEIEELKKRVNKLEQKTTDVKNHKK